MPTRCDVGQTIMQALARRKVTQADLSRAIGVSDTAVSLWCVGITSPTAVNRAKLAKYLGITEALLDDGTRNGPQRGAPRTVWKDTRSKPMPAPRDEEPRPTALACRHGDPRKFGVWCKLHRGACSQAGCTEARAMTTHEETVLRKAALAEYAAEMGYDTGGGYSKPVTARIAERNAR